MRHAIALAAVAVLLAAPAQAQDVTGWLAELTQPNEEFRRNRRRAWQGALTSRPRVVAPPPFAPVDVRGRYESEIITGAIETAPRGIEAPPGPAVERATLGRRIGPALTCITCWR